ncbi:MAG: hypothetical protein AAF938_22655, partial [Myxococcota bacterium]
MGHFKAVCAAILISTVATAADAQRVNVDVDVDVRARVHVEDDGTERTLMAAPHREPIRAALFIQGNLQGVAEEF